MDTLNITGRCLFLGDSMYDYQAATTAQMDFVFISQWTEVCDWKDKFTNNTHPNLSSLL